MATAPEYILGFRVLADLLGRSIVGEPLEDEHWEGNGDSLQGTSCGLLVYRKALNSPGFTNGDHTWVLGPNGLQDRPNAVLFDWERLPAPYRPSVLYMPLAASSDTFPFLTTPKGFALHGTRSGVSRPARSEFPQAAGYETTRTDGCGANCTVGDDAVALHVPWNRWCWHARRASRYYISIEIAQGTADDEVTDAEVRAAAWVVREAREAVPSIPLVFRTHAELENEGETGPNPITGRPDGKSDVYPWRDPRADELRRRINDIL